MDDAWSHAIGSRYVGSILTLDGRTTLYTESDGWTAAADEILPQ
jgi:hypothetical protein